MNAKPDWKQDDCVTSLKTVLKWEIQHLLQRLAEVGEEAVLFTVSVKDGDTTEMGSPKGQVFLSVSDLQDMKTQFQSYCRGFSVNAAERMEVYRDLSSGQLSLGPKSTIETEHRKKHTKNANAYLQKSKIPHIDPAQFRTVRHDVSSDDNSGGNSLYSGLTPDENRLEAMVETEPIPVRSRRKRTPKKVLSSYTSGDDIGDNMSLENSDQAKDEFENQSEISDLTGSPFENFQVKKSQSMNQISDNQSESLEMAYHSEDGGSRVLPQSDFETVENSYNMSQRSWHQPETSGHQLEDIFLKDRNTVSRRTKKTARKSIKANSNVSYNTDVNCSLLTEKSMPVFPGCSSDGNMSSVYANSVGVSNNVGGDNVFFPQTMVGEDGRMTIVMSQPELGEDMLVSNSENSLQAGSSKSLDSSPTLNKQGPESDLGLSPQRKRCFKPIPHDEDPAETALLDASKLAIGRYKCPLCSQTTRDRHDLKRHLRTHTKEKPYQCSLCGKRFTRKWDLENHYSRHDKIDQDKINAKMRKLSNKRINISTSDVLTYENLVSKLLMEKNIPVKGMDDSSFNSVDHSLFVDNENNLSTNVENQGVENMEPAQDLMQENSGKDTKVETMDINEGANYNDTFEDEAREEDFSETERGATGTHFDSLDLNNSVSTMNTKGGTVNTEDGGTVNTEGVTVNTKGGMVNTERGNVNTEGGNVIGNEQGNEIKIEPESDIR